MTQKIIPLRADAAIELSVIVPVGRRRDDAVGLYQSYRDALARAGRVCEFIYVIEPGTGTYADALRALQARGEPVVVIELAQRFGEATSINVGVERARAECVLVLPAYLQIEAHAVPALVDALGRVDLAAAVRDRRDDHLLSRGRAWCLAQVGRLAGSEHCDLGCMAVAARRSVLLELALQDEHHRFIPLLAAHAGYKIEYVLLPQAAADRGFRWHGPATYIGRAVDLMAMAFLLRFMQRPFRFFGSVGALMAIAGVVLGAVLSFQRLALHMPLAERPALLLAVLLVVLGVQIAAVGLIAEIIIFSRARKLPSYRIEQLVEQSTPLDGQRSDPAPAPASAPRAADGAASGAGV